MKVVIFAGGLGTRLREETEFRPKPLVKIGDRPILWHIMKNFISQGFREFVVLGGYKVDQIQEFFVNYVPTSESTSVQIAKGRPFLSSQTNTDDFDCTVHVLNTGLSALTGERLARARSVIGGARFFLTYGDGLADIDLHKLIARHEEVGAKVTISATKPTNRFGVIETVGSSLVKNFREKPKMSDLVNIGFAVCEPEVFDYIDGNESFEEGPLKRLTDASSLAFFEHTGFWHPMDTIRDHELLESMWSTGDAPWKVWN